MDNLKKHFQEKKEKEKANVSKIKDQGELIRWVMTLFSVGSSLVIFFIIKLVNSNADSDFLHVPYSTSSTDQNLSEMINHPYSIQEPHPPCQEPPLGFRSSKFSGRLRRPGKFCYFGPPKSWFYKGKRPNMKTVIEIQSWGGGLRKWACTLTSYDFLDRIWAQESLELSMKLV